MSRKIELPIHAAPNRERVGHGTWGPPLDGPQDAETWKAAKMAGYSLDDVAYRLEAAGCSILAIDVQHITDDFMFWIEWAEGSDKTLPPGFRRCGWRDLE